MLWLSGGYRLDDTKLSVTKRLVSSIAFWSLFGGCMGSIQEIEVCEILVAQDCDRLRSAAALQTHWRRTTSEVTISIPLSSPKAVSATDRAAMPAVTATASSITKPRSRQGLCEPGLLKEGGCHGAKIVRNRWSTRWGSLPGPANQSLFSTATPTATTVDPPAKLWTSMEWRGSQPISKWTSVDSPTCRSTLRRHRQPCV